MIINDMVMLRRMSRAVPATHLRILMGKSQGRKTIRKTSSRGSNMYRNECIQWNSVFSASWRSQLGFPSPSPSKTHGHYCFSNIELAFHRNPQTASKLNETVPVDVLDWKKTKSHQSPPP
jgi:hypothetical protein